MNATESLLTLYRAARDFTRRAIGAEELERAAIAYAKARGWTPRSSTEREENLRARVETLEAAIGRVIDARDNDLGQEEVMRAARFDLALDDLSGLVIR